MSSFDMFCERCGKHYGSDSQTAAEALPLARRFLRAVGVSANTPQPVAEAPFLRFCLACRGYSCPECWNEDAGFCQTCVPLPEPAVAFEHMHEPIAAFAPEVPLVPALDLAAPPVAGTAREEEPFATEAWSAWSGTVPTLEPVDLQLEAVATEPETVAVEIEAEPVVAEAEAAVEAEPLVAHAEAAYKPEAMVVAEAQAESDAEPLALVAETEAQQVVVEAVAEYESEETVAVEAEAEPEPILGLAERPIEFVVADEEHVDEFEAEAEIHWDWSLDAAQTVLAIDLTEQADDAAPVAVDDAVPVAAADEEELPVATADEELPVAAAEPVAPSEPDAPAEPAEPVFVPAIFRPLTPLGPIVTPPPPPSATPVPLMQFELPEAPPAFVIAPARPTLLARPVLPFGLFDGPGPAIKPCSTCELPVSARARFCRRCGSAQL